MVVRTVTKDRKQELLDLVRSRRQLPATGSERRQIREQAGVSLRQLAAAVGVSAMAVVRWENGAKPRNPDHLRAYADLLAELRREVTADERPAA